MQVETESEILQTLSKVVLELKEVRAELQRLSDPSKEKREGWLPTIKAAEALNVDGISSVRHLRNLKDEGIFSEVKGEIRDISPGSRPTWQYHIPSCRKALRRHFSGLVVAK